MHPNFDMAQERPGVGFMNAVYAWMCLGLGLTAATACWVSGQPDLLKTIYSTGPFIGLALLELLLVVVISACFDSLGGFGAALLFGAYSFLNGLTLSAIFAMYTLPSIGATFAVTAGMFAVMSLYGFVTKRDLTSVGSLLFMALIGLIIATVVNIFLASAMLDYLLTVAGIAIFVGLTAYDTQRMKEIARERGSADGLSVACALILYLDFINLFLQILKLMGKKKD